MTRAWISALFALASSINGCGGETPAPRGPTSAAAPLPEPVEASPAAEAPPAEEPPTSAAVPAASAAGEGQKPAPDKNASETRTSEVIALVIRDNRKPFRDCYDKTQKDLPDLHGTLTLHFVLDPDGKVKTAELNQERSTITAKAVVDCAVTVLRGMKFPPSSRGMESVINYPFDFKR